MSDPIVCPCEKYEPLLTTDAESTNWCVCGQGHSYLDHLGQPERCTHVFKEPA
jgi:hypothetical protein